MTKDIDRRLNELRCDYERVTGRPFEHFWCPVLFSDESVGLCKAHIVNAAFPESSRRWTVQRSDVDNFYGSDFEADFLAMRYREGWSPSDALADPVLSRQLRPRIVADAERIAHYVADGDVPECFTPVRVDGSGRTVELVLKMRPEQVQGASEREWWVEISKDVRVAAVVSLIKAAHLTLFEMLGYQYALSAAGHFVGAQILGRFFLENRGKAKPEVIANALPYFREFAGMVRPLQGCGPDLQGTITDGRALVCGGPGEPAWAVIVLVRTSSSLHAVMVPTLADAQSAVKFQAFLHNQAECVETALVRFEEGMWQAEGGRATSGWPKSGTLYP